MRIRDVALIAVTMVTTGAIGSGEQPKPAAREHVMLSASELKWAAAPAYLPRGAEISTLAGDMAKPGLFIVRIKFPANYKIPPHWHSADEHITVISGAVTMGMGEKENDRGLKTIEAGGHAMMPAKRPHFLRTTAEAVVERTATGPFRTTYVNQRDDPSRVR
jgi:quercetin dioxygenase-like cupin family protein